MIELLRRLTTSRGGRWGVTAAVCLALSLAYGCDDVQFNWEPDQASKPRPAGPPVGRTTSPPNAGASASPTASATPTPRPGEARPAPVADRTEAPPPLLSVYQLVLLSEPGPAVGPAGLKHVRLGKARARDVANVLSITYLPSGPSGTDHRYTLVYPTALEQTLAAEAASLLDVAAPSAEPARNESATNIWHWCAAETFTVMDQPVVPGPRLRHLADRALQVVPSTELSRVQRWIAAMIAADVLANRVYDYAAADRAYEQAQGVAEPGSYEQMSTIFARSKARLQDGKRDEARQLSETIVGQFSTLRGCEVFERTREALDAWEKRRQ